MSVDNRPRSLAAGIKQIAVIRSSNPHTDSLLRHSQVSSAAVSGGLRNAQHLLPRSPHHCTPRWAETPPEQIASASKTTAQLVITTWHCAAPNKETRPAERPCKQQTMLVMSEPSTRVMRYGFQALDHPQESECRSKQAQNHHYEPKAISRK